MRILKNEASRRIDITVRIPRWLKYNVQKFAGEQNRTLTSVIEEGMNLVMEKYKK